MENEQLISTAKTLLTDKLDLPNCTQLVAAELQKLFDVTAVQAQTAANTAFEIWSDDYDE